jgi:hypothetical protein
MLLGLHFRPRLLSSFLLGSLFLSISPVFASIDTTYDVKLGPNIGSGEEMGNSVSAGDLNNDGYDDVIVGAYGNNDYTGAVYIYFGSASGITLTPNVTLTGAVLNDEFGWAADSAGDVNNDGYDDVVVGAFRNNSNTGAAYIYYGSASGITLSPNRTLTGAAIGDQFGLAVAGAGDVNNDGYDDIMVGAPRNNSITGKTYIYYGSASGPSALPDITLTGAGVSDQFGYTLSPAGDMNQDGYDDILVTSTTYDSSTGRAYLYYGGSSMDSTPDVIFTGAATEDNFGYSMGSAGDVNHDGFLDVIIGAYANDTAGANAGIAYIYYGGVSMDNVADVTLYGSAGDFFGNEVISAGDINDDGYDDVFIEAERYPDFSDCCTGRAYIYYGGASMDTVADLTFDAESHSDFGGYQTPLAVADLNGDGYEDIIVGAVGADDNAYDGAVYVYYGSPPPPPSSSSSSSSSAVSSVSSEPEPPHPSGGGRRGSTLTGLVQTVRQQLNRSSVSAFQSSSLSIRSAMSSSLPHASSVSSSFSVNSMTSSAKSESTLKKNVEQRKQARQMMRERVQARREQRLRKK